MEGNGRRFETDLQLRPSGASGLMVSAVEAFKRYQEQDAWVWDVYRADRFVRRHKAAVASVIRKHRPRLVLAPPRQARHPDHARSGHGAVLHTLNPRLHPDQLAWIANHAEATPFFPGLVAANTPVVWVVEPLTGPLPE